MRVLVITVVHHPDDARISRRQIPALLAAGHQVALAAPWNDVGATPQGKLIGIDLPRARGRRRAAALRAARTVLRRHGPGADLILLHDPELIPLCAGLALPPVVWDVHEDTAAAIADKPWLPTLLRGGTRQAIHRLEGFAERRLHLILAEEGYRDRFSAAHPVVPNVPNLPEDPQGPGGARVVYIGRISRGRGVQELIALAGRLPACVQLDLVGPADADVRDALVDAHDRGLVRWHGFVPNDEALRLLDGALAGLSPLRNEPNYRHSMPTKVLEYMAWGIPVIATPTPPARRIIESSDAGIIVPFGDVDGMVAAVASLHADPALRLALGRRGRAAVERSYDWGVRGPEFVTTLEGWAAV